MFDYSKDSEKYIKIAYFVISIKTAVRKGYILKNILIYGKLKGPIK